MTITVGVDLAVVMTATASLMTGLATAICEASRELLGTTLVTGIVNRSCCMGMGCMVAERWLGAMEWGSR